MVTRNKVVLVVRLALAISNLRAAVVVTAAIAIVAKILVTVKVVVEIVRVVLELKAMNGGTRCQLLDTTIATVVAANSKCRSSRRSSRNRSNNSIIITVVNVAV